MSEQIVLRCEDSLEGIFTALFDAFVCKNKMIVLIKGGNVMKKIALTTTVPVEVLFAAGYTPIDLNNLFVN